MIFYTPLSKVISKKLLIDAYLLVKKGNNERWTNNKRLFCIYLLFFFSLLVLLTSPFMLSGWIFGDEKEENRSIRSYSDILWTHYSTYTNDWITKVCKILLDITLEHVFLFLRSIVPIYDDWICLYSNKFNILY